MIPTPPYTQMETVPADVHLYLTQNGWIEHRDMQGNMWYYQSGYSQYFRWYEALPYIMWKKLHLGAL